MSNFYRYFKENMDQLGLPAPESLFGTLQAALANATAFVTQIDKFGAVIGSIAVATGRTISGGTSLSDVLLLARLNNLERSWLRRKLKQMKR